MHTEYDDWYSRGKTIRVPATQIRGRTIIVATGWLKTASVKDEDVYGGEAVDNPELFVRELRQSTLKADMFSFAQKLGNPRPKYQYHMDWENAAVIPLKSYADWWEKRLSQDTRRNVRRATKAGVTVRTTQFDDELVKGIKDIYDESPVRQGTRFLHYHKEFEVVKREAGTYLDRSEYIGAYYNGGLIGFIKLIYADECAHIIHILSKVEHMDKRVTNALIAKAVEISAERGLSYLTYSKYVDGKNDQSALTEFKRRNGFEQLLYPRYYVPLSVKGKIVLALKLHRGLSNLLPRWSVVFLLDLRARFYQITNRKAAVAAESSS